MTVGLVDLGRLARNTALDAAQAATPGLHSGLELQGLAGGVRSRLRTVTRQHDALVRAAADGSVHGADRLVDDLARAMDSLGGAGEALARPEVAAGRGWQARIPFIGRAHDTSGAVEHLSRASDDLARAARGARDAALAGVRLIDAETSPVVATASDAALPRVVDDATRVAMDAIDPRWLEFDPALQRRLARVFDATFGRAVGTRFEGLEHVTAGQAIYTSTHPSLLDPTALLQGIHRGGGQSVRTMAVAPVANALGGVGRAAGVFPARTRSFSGLDGARRMLEAGQSVAIFPEGDVYSLARGSSSEARSGIAVLASEFDVPVVPSAGYGHQGRRVAGGARGASPVLRFGEPIRFRPAPAGAGDAERAAHVAEVAEVYAQAHDRLLQQAVASYRGA